MTADISFDDLRPRSWLNAFPWLRAVAAAGVGGETGWWDEAIDDTSHLGRRKRLATISELAMERLTRWTIGQILPGLPQDLSLWDLRMPTRAINALGNRGHQVSSDLTGVVLDDMLSWRQVGVGTVDAILQALADASTSLATPAVLTDHAASAFAAPHDQVQLPPRVNAVIDDLSLIATWYATVGVPSKQLIGSPLPPGTPEEIVKARQRLEALTASDVLMEGEVELDVAGHFDDALHALDWRAARILERRLFADQPTTLDELGREFGVTRERVRQIEGKARAAMLEFLGPGSTLEMVAESARSLIGMVRPLDDLLTLMPAFAKQVESVEQPAWRVLDRLDDAYEIEDGWCVVPTMSAAQTVTQSRLQELADQYGVVRVDDVDLVEALEPGGLAALTKSWLTYFGYTTYGDFVFTRTQSVGGYAASILSVTGSPMSAQDIVDRFSFERSAGSLRNAMSTDDRFERVDRDRWALSEWGMDAYSGVRSLIRQEVARGAGRAELEALVEHITGKYTVTASSVVAYASSAPFELRDGIVRLAAADREIRKTPERTRRLYRWDDAWAYRVRITNDHLRGSGSVAPVAIASILNLQFGESRQLDSPLGPQSINWTGIQPAFGTIRRFLMEADVPADTDVFLVIGDDGTFAAKVVPELTDEPFADSLRLIGAPDHLRGEAAHAALTAAIGLPVDSPVASIIGRYRERADSDISDLLLAARDQIETDQVPERSAPSTDVDEILDLL